MKADKAFIFDLNGTVIDDMMFHVESWKILLDDYLKKHLTYDEVKAQMYGKSSELFDRIFGKGYFTDEYIHEMVIKKEEIYQEQYKPHMKLLPGLDRFFKKAKARNIPMAIGTAAIPFNLDYILDNLNIREYFDELVTADDVVHSKPDPQTFTLAADKMGYQYQNCIVFEDAPKGVEAAQNAGMKTVVILSELHGEADFKAYNNIIQYITDYHQLDIDSLLK
ncbi:HAD family hydrolase [Polluticaenibacter yanchengensis]|uniref:HAD-IA family hydrolase n=1 Tax=Polluticaenibacter yanchengensis TaxID=3014562 RepID=A0ABT4UI80_9BACT|nr:HAD-IA family hydrolase [Chitinophagaceae bacterium LY-5]